jgi:hypothetical protein
MRRLKRHTHFARSTVMIATIKWTSPFLSEDNPSHATRSKDLESRPSKGAISASI